MDQDKPVDPEIELEIKEAMAKAATEMQDESIKELATFMGKTFRAYRKQGFSRKQAFTFAVLLYQRYVIG